MRASTVEIFQSFLSKIFAIYQSQHVLSFGNILPFPVNCSRHTRSIFALLWCSLTFVEKI